MHGKVFVGAAQNGCEVVLECLHCSFSDVAAVNVGRHQLVIHVVVGQVVFKFCADFVVHSNCFGLTTFAD